jgi:hypothetical protein
VKEAQYMLHTDVIEITHVGIGNDGIIIIIADSF